MKYRVAQIIPYFGKWPEWIELYFYSCGKNPMIDFIFYTDCKIPENHPENLIFNKRTYEEYSSLISNRLNIKYNNPKPYKLTDLKPFIGYIHEQELKEYDFWGFGDIDLVYGDLSKIVNDTMLDKYDLITTHNYHIAGHFCLCRNNEYYKNACFKIKNWKHVIEREKPMSIDELDWTYIVCPYHKLIGRINKYICKPFGIHYFTVLDSLHPIFHKRLYLHECWTSPIPKENEKWVYDIKNNSVTDSQNRELPYLHFLFFKKTQWLDTDIYWKENFYNIGSDIKLYDKIIISDNGIYNYR